MESAGRRRRMLLPVLLLVAGLSGLALPPSYVTAEAVTAPPWRWTKVTGSLNIQAVTNSSTNLVCPAGYIPVSGGFEGDGAVSRMLEYPNPGINGFTWTLRNSSVVVKNVPLTLWCAHQDDVGGIVSVTHEFPEGGNNRAGGVAPCPDGYGLLSGGVDWGTTGARTIDQSGPTPLGDGWFANGSSGAANDTLYIEVRCIPNSQLSSEVTVVTSSNVSGDLTATCPSGKRLLTGGSWLRLIGSNAFDNTFRGTAFASAPPFAGAATTWRARSSIAGNSTFTAIALCIPVSIPLINLTQVPANPTTTNTGTFTFTASDPAGESLVFGCTIDGGSVPCSPGNPVAFGPLTDGNHEIVVQAHNSSYNSMKFHSWLIDATAPTVTTRTPLTVASVNPVFSAGFSEAVQGVDVGSFRIRPVGSAQTLAASTVPSDGVQLVTSATLTPTAMLTPGRRYAIELTVGIKDQIGHDLVPPAWEVRADPQVENTSVALVETWDPDTSSAASGGGYISSRTSGTRATVGFTASAGGAATLYGMRQPGGGYAELWLDGVKRSTTSFYATSLRRSAIRQFTGLVPGSKHTLEIRVLGTKPSNASAAWVSLDSMVAASTVQETGFGQRARRVANASASGGSYDTLAHTLGGDTGGRPGYRLSFHGTGIKVYATKTTTAGKAEIYVDGALKATVNLRASGTVPNLRVYSATLPLGPHTIRVQPVGTSSGTGSWVTLDRFVVS